MSNDYQRLFYIFKNMDNDPGNPSGYIKIEINGDSAKMQTSLNGLYGRQDAEYELYGIARDEKGLRYTSICHIDHVNGRADIKVNEDRHSIGSDGLNLDEINIFAVIAGGAHRGSPVRCPLVAYKKEELQWKRDFERSLDGSLPVGKTTADSRDSRTADLKDISENAFENIPEHVPGIAAEEEEQRAPEAAEERAEYGEDSADVSDAADTADTADMREEEGFETESGVIWPAADQPESRGRDNDISGSESPENSLWPKLDHDIKDDLASKFESTLTSIYNNDGGVYRDSGFAFEEKAASGDGIEDLAGMDFKEMSSTDQDDERLKTELDMQSLREELDKSFETCSPFKMKSRRFKWWKINSPGYLNNILFRNNVKTYLLFNPKVMLAQYKYRYIIFGIRNDRNSGRERLVCGVPGIYNIDENPFGNIGSWAQLEGYKPKYGAFGYWIILIDPRTGKLIKIK